MMVNELELEEYKKTVQTIIDKYLPEDKRFSVKDFSEEWLYYIASLFLEKNPEKREEIYQEIEAKKKEADENEDKDDEIGEIGKGTTIKLRRRVVEMNLLGVFG